MYNKKALKFIYKNWKGVTSTRNVIPETIYFGSTAFHDEEQWLMVAHDIDKHAIRTFAMTDIISWIKENPVERADKCNHKLQNGDSAIVYDSIYEMRSSDMHCSICGEEV